MLRRLRYPGHRGTDRGVDLPHQPWGFATLRSAVFPARLVAERASCGRDRREATSMSRGSVTVRGHGGVRPILGGDRPLAAARRGGCRMAAVVPKQQTQDKDSGWPVRGGRRAHRTGRPRQRPSGPFCHRPRRAGEQSPRRRKPSANSARRWSRLPAVHGWASRCGRKTARPALPPDRAERHRRRRLADNVEQLVKRDRRCPAGAPRPDGRAAGEASLNAGIWSRSAQTGRAEKLSLPITFILMLLAFGALIAAASRATGLLGGRCGARVLNAPLSYLFPDGDRWRTSFADRVWRSESTYSLFYLKRNGRNAVATTALWTRSRSQPPPRDIRWSSRVGRQRVDGWSVRRPGRHLSSMATATIVVGRSRCGP